MPQLITVPYNHVYITVLLIIAVGLLNYFKILMPSFLKIIKFNMKLKIKSITNNLLYINLFNSSSMLIDLYFNIVSFYFYYIDLCLSKSIKMISKEATQSNHIVNFLINLPIYNLHKNDLS